LKINSYTIFLWLSLLIPKVSTIWIKNSSDPIVCHGRTASYLTAPAQIPACGITALGSSEILASVTENDVAICITLYLRGYSSLLVYLFPDVRHLIVTHFDATLSMGGWRIELTQQGLPPCKKYRASWLSSAKSYRIIEH